MGEIEDVRGQIHVKIQHEQCCTRLSWIITTWKGELNGFGIMSGNMLSGCRKFVRRSGSGAIMGLLQCSVAMVQLWWASVRIKAKLSTYSPQWYMINVGSEASCYLIMIHCTRKHPMWRIKQLWASGKPATYCVYHVFNRNQDILTLGSESWITVLYPLHNTYNSHILGWIKPTGCCGRHVGFFRSTETPDLFHLVCWETSIPLCGRANNFYCKGDQHKLIAACLDIRHVGISRNCQ